MKSEQETVVYLTPAEVAARYKGVISLSTLSHWRSLGEGPPWTKVGSRVLYPQHLLEDWERKRTTYLRFGK